MERPFIDRPTITFLDMPTTIPDNNAPVRFIAIFRNDYDDTVNDFDDFIETFRREFCDDTGISCSRLTRPRSPEDVEKVTIKES